MFEGLEKTPGLDAAIASLRESRDKVRKTNALIQTIEVSMNVVVCYCGLLYLEFERFLIVNDVNPLIDGWITI